MTHEENNLDPKSITNLSNDAVDGKNVMGGSYATGSESGNIAGSNEEVHDLAPGIEPLDNTLPGPLDEPGNPLNNPLDAHNPPGFI